MNILDNFYRLLFCFHTFGVRRLLYALGQRAPDPGLLSEPSTSMVRLTPKI